MMGYNLFIFLVFLTLLLMLAVSCNGEEPASSGSSGSCSGEGLPAPLNQLWAIFCNFFAWIIGG